MINPNHGSWLALASTNQTNMLNAKKQVKSTKGRGNRPLGRLREVGEKLNETLDDIAGTLLPRQQAPQLIPVKR